ncbi:MAG: hypothetical protein NDI69_06685 [Bacteriovoracaceae bacterium]|nr:hypothetical protein [Bacteriovoracaceae bacterium]
MKIVVTDTNVFVVFFRCDLLSVLLTSQLVEINIPQEILKELTTAGKRVPREYPNLVPIINGACHGNGGYQGMRILVKDVNVDIVDVDALGALINLQDDSDLDDGEIEAIPLAIELKADFVSGDEGAVAELNEQYSGLGAVGKSVDIFIDDLVALGVLNPTQSSSLKAILAE